MNAKWRHLISFAMVLCLLVCAVPMGALAANGQALTPELFVADRSEIVRQLKVGLANHESLITVYYKTIDLPTDEEVQTLFTDAFNVVDVLGVPAAYAGDYLNGSVAAVDAQLEYTVQDIYFYNQIEYHVTYVNSLKEETAFRGKLEQTLSALREDTHNDYQRCKNIYDYIASHVTKVDGGKRSAYEAFTVGEAAPQGYAALFYAMAKNMGMDCRVITGTLNGAEHAWNIVQVYGKWYELDITNGVFLKSTNPAVRDEFYSSKQFNRAYPMAEADLQAAELAGGDLGNGLRWNYNAATATLTISGQGAMKDFTVQTQGGLATVKRPWTAYVSEGAYYVIEDGVTSIGAYTFYNVVMEGVKIPASVQTMGASAFENARVASVELPAGMTTIPANAFKGSWVYELTIPNGVTEIGDGAFAGCMRMVRLNLPATLKTIGDAVCNGCYSLKDLSFAGERKLWDAIEMGQGNELLTELMDNSGVIGFSDVKSTDWFYKPVMWAVKNDVTGGIGNGMFGPQALCTRAQVVTFLWAANGKPAPQTAENPFTDVADDAWYAKAVLWAVENGITGGTSPTTFGPDNYCTRAQVVTFLYAAAGKPEMTASSTFDDVADSDWYAKPVIWAKENNVTGGISATEFGPNNTCTRAQVVTFLYKVYQ